MPCYHSSLHYVMAVISMLCIVFLPLPLSHMLAEAITIDSNAIPSFAPTSFVQGMHVSSL